MHYEPRIDSEVSDEPNNGSAKKFLSAEARSAIDSVLHSQAFDSLCLDLQSTH